MIKIEKLDQKKNYFRHHTAEVQNNVTTKGKNKQFSLTNALGF